jgi:hypothetical protein
MKKISVVAISCFLFLILYNNITYAQLSPQNPIYDEILRADSLLFEAGFKDCNYDALYRATDTSFTFYHDQSGITSGQESFVKGIKNNICSIDYRPIRKLIKETTEIYPLKSSGKIYGVIQKGIHEFYAVEKNKDPYLTSTAKFTHVWIKKENQWKLQTVLSFDHQTPDNNENQQ